MTLRINAENCYAIGGHIEDERPKNLRRYTVHCDWGVIEIMLTNGKYYKVKLFKFFQNHSIAKPAVINYRRIPPDKKIAKHLFRLRFRQTLLIAQNPLLI
jgi:hypothetical protein